MSYIHSLAKGLLISIVLFLSLSIFFAPIILFTNLSEKLGFLCMIIVLCVATFIFGFYSGREIGKKGLLIGVFSGFLLSTIILFSAFMAFFKEPNIDFLSPTYTLPILSGGIGGIVGVNVKK